MKSMSNLLHPVVGILMVQRFFIDSLHVIGPAVPFMFSTGIDEVEHRQPEVPTR